MKIENRVDCVLSNFSFSAQGSPASFAGDSSVTVENTSNDGRLSGTISAEEDSFAFFAIPYEQGWSAVLDGEPVELVRADYGFTGFYVSAGQHTFSFTYELPGLKAGGAASLICLCLLAGNFHCQQKAEKTGQRVKNQGSLPTGREGCLKIQDLPGCLTP